MANVAKWVNEQVQLIDNGVAVSVFRVLDANDSAWGTWPATLPEAGTRIESALAELGDDFATGNHSLRLVALDAKGQQLAALPYVLQGRSQAQKTAQQNAMNTAKAHAISIQTAESQMMTMNERALQAEGRALDTFNGAMQLADAFMGLKQKIVLDEISQQERERRWQLMGELAEQTKPVVSALSQLVADLLKEKMAEAKRKKGS